MNLETTTIETSLGEMTLFACGAALCALEFSERRRHTLKALEKRFGLVTLRDSPDPAGAASALRAYEAGHLDALLGIRVETGGTEFQRRVWEALRAIPAGETLSYASLARTIGHPAAVRAVGDANARNPIAIVIPCHRVIGSDGELRGYAGGIERKRRLLEHERRHAPSPVTI
jgi:methylated-DNA-[protein]-cysteine S-methyltransferase